MIFFPLTFLFSREGMKLFLIAFSFEVTLLSFFDAPTVSSLGQGHKKEATVAFLVSSYSDPANI